MFAKLKKVKLSHEMYEYQRVTKQKAPLLGAFFANHQNKLKASPRIPTSTILEASKKPQNAVSEADESVLHRISSMPKMKQLT